MTFVHLSPTGDNSKPQVDKMGRKCNSLKRKWVRQNSTLKNQLLRISKEDKKGKRKMKRRTGYRSQGKREYFEKKKMVKNKTSCPLKRLY